MSRTAAALNAALTAGGYACELFPDGRSVLAAIQTQLPDLLVLGLTLPDASGIDVLRKVRGIAPTLPVIMMMERISVGAAAAALKLGVTDLRPPPVEPGQAMAAARLALKTTDLQRQLDYMKSEVQDRYRMVGESTGLKEVRSLIRQVAPTSASVLVTGESGVGKKLVARAIHLQSPRATRPFVSVNCAAIPRELLEDELFGHEKGAFTGARTASIGRIREANAGTIFLDEIGDLSLAAQAKLLRFLSGSEVRRSDGRGLTHADVRVIATTKRYLHELTQRDVFRDYLHHRLHVVTINVPPLRERVSDIELLGSFFLDQACTEHSRAVCLAAACWPALKAYSWPGNIRQLRHLIERVVILAETNPVEAEELLSFLGAEDKAPVRETLKTSLERAEREAAERALEQTGYDVAEAAAMLGIVRASLYRIMKRYGIVPPNQARSGT